MSLSERYGFFARTLWELPENAALRARRGRMDVLLTGDEVVIPDVRPWSGAVDAGERHVFRRKGVPAVFRLVLRARGRPRAHVGWRLVAAGVEVTGRTGADGLVTAHVPASASTGLLYLDDHASPLTLRFGHMDPLDTTSGVRKRLRNLSMTAPDDDDLASPAWRRAIDALQARVGLPRTGSLDDETRQRLGALHDDRGGGAR